MSASSNLKRFLILAVAIGISLGCQANQNLVTSFPIADATTPTLGGSYLTQAQPRIEQNELPGPVNSISPEAIIDYQAIQYQGISLDQCIRTALKDSEVFRDLGGTLISATGAVDSALDPALTFSDPTFGEDAALSAFDARFLGTAFGEVHNVPFNNNFTGDDGILAQDLAEVSAEFTKLTATGTTFNARSSVIYERNNQSGQRFPQAFEATFEGGFRTPLLQGAGTLFNRIAGPSQTPGANNGVLIARTNTEISLTEFESSVRDFVSDVENAYWDLYFAYRELEAQTDARDAAKFVLERATAEVQEKRKSSLTEASAKEQYLRFEVSIIDSLEGRIIEGTQSNSGSSGGSFRGTVGVRVAERRLRYLIGMPITDGRLLQPIDQPVKAPLIFDWDLALETTLYDRPEQQRQRWLIKQRELELTAARNFLLPRLDIVGSYTARGLGRNLTNGVSLNSDVGNAGESGAFRDLFSGDFHEVQLGAEFSLPVGYRQANAAVRNAELSVQRERMILKEQEKRLILDLSNAIAEARRAHSAMRVAEKRFQAAVEYRKQASLAIERGRSQFDVLLEAQRRVLEAQLQFNNAEVEYGIAIKNVHFEKATYLDFNGISLVESRSRQGAYVDNERKKSKRKKEINFIFRDATIGNSELSTSLHDQPAIDQPAIDQPVIDQPVFNQPIIDQPVFNQPIIDQPHLGHAPLENQTLAPLEEAYLVNQAPPQIPSQPVKGGPALYDPILNDVQTSPIPLYDPFLNNRSQTNLPLSGQ